MATKDQEEKWLGQHIPHRVKAVMARLSLQENLIRSVGESHRAKITSSCDDSAIAQGRLAAIRWLIEFVGIADLKGKPARPRQGPFDISITQLTGGKEIALSSPEAEELRKVWKGCAQANGHPTDGSCHPPVEPKELESAIGIIMTHLDSTIYAVAGKRLDDALSA